MSLHGAVLDAAMKGYVWRPQITRSASYKHWVSIKDLRRCLDCADMHGKIWYIYEEPEIKPPLHPFGRCKIERMDAITAGTATMHGQAGADWAIKQIGELPDYYVLQKEAELAGWGRGKWPSNFIPGKMMGGDIYKNKNDHLPDAPGRVWYEADINYETGKRNNCRIVYSNDGLMFATYDHYKTFYEVV